MLGILESVAIYRKSDGYPNGTLPFLDRDEATILNFGLSVGFGEFADTTGSKYTYSIKVVVE